MLATDAENQRVTPLLRINRLGVAFSRHGHTQVAIDSVDLQVEAGRTTVLLGESGCGKSITALAIMRLLPPAARVTAGEILLDGENLLNHSPLVMRQSRGRRIGMVFQEPQSALNPVLPIGRQIAEALQLHLGLCGKTLRGRVVELLDAVGIPEPGRRLHDYPFQLSGGMKQRVVIAIAIAGEPELVLADEPTTALDVTTQAQVLVSLKKIQRQRGMGMLFITHDLGVASEVADQVTVMKQGRIVETAPAARFFSAPAHSYSRHLFASLPRSPGRPVSAPDAENAVLSTRPILSLSEVRVGFPGRQGVQRDSVGTLRGVDGVSMEIPEGRTLAVVGESGSGKTTLGKAIVQLLRPTSGSVIYKGHDLTRMSQGELRRWRADIQIVFQDPYSSLNPRMTVADIIQEGMLAQRTGGDRRRRSQAVDHLLDQVGLSPRHKSRYPHEFSGGQRQRICIARALAVKPKLVVLDEPTSALDVPVQAQILSLLQQLQAELKLTYLFISHDIGVVECMAHEIAVMHAGRIVEQGMADEVLNRPRSEYTRRLLAAVPVIRGAAA